MGGHVCLHNAMIVLQAPLYSAHGELEHSRLMLVLGCF